MGRKRRRTEWEDSAAKNVGAYGLYYDALKQLAISMFEWKNIPDSVDERFLEITLFHKGAAVYFNDDVMGNLALEVLLNGQFNVYRIPTKRTAIAANGYKTSLDENNSVIIYENMIHTCPSYMCRKFARELEELDRIIDVNCRAQKTPVLIQGEEQQMLTLKNVYMMFDGNQPVIYGNKNLDINAIKVLKTDAPYVADKLYTLKTQKWNEALTYLGISNVNTQKKERLVGDEVVRSLGGTFASRYSRLNSRRQAADMINRMFGTNIEVDFREDYRQIDDQFMIELDQNGEVITDTMVREVKPQRGYSGEGGNNE